jgi:methyl-accepting chemotaxis protein
MLKHLKIANKIYTLGIFQQLLMLLMGATAILQMSKIGAELVDIAEVDIPLGEYVTLITAHQFEQTILFERALFHSALSKQNVSSSAQHFTDLKSEVVKMSQVIDKEIVNTERFVEKSIGVMQSEEGKTKLRDALSVLKDIEKKYAILNGKMQSVLIEIDSSELPALANSVAELEVLETTLRQQLNGLLEEIQKYTEKAALQAEHDEQSGIIWIIVIFIATLIVGSILPYIIGRSITIPIRLLSSRLNEVASGDGDLTLSLDEKARDETGDVARAFNKFLAVLRELIRNTNAQADVLGASSEVAMKAMRETETNVDKQRTETEMVATAVTEMSSTTQEVAKSTEYAADLTQQVRDKVSEGQQDALETQGIIKKLSEEVADASHVIQNLVEETNSIGSVLESIQGIAAQTNLLALNAAIEAARAGESGRGFAVVADEVRTLAQRTQTSTVDIQELLLRLKSEANNAVTSMNKGSESAEACLEKSAKTSKTFEEASASVDLISDLNAQIATASEEQSAVAEEVNKNLLNISHLAEVTAEGAKNTSEANNTIAKRVIDLHANLNVFVV